MKKLNLIIPDMKSQHCQHRVQKTLQSIPGIHISRITSGEIEMEIPDAIREEQVRHAITTAGYVNMTKDESSK